MSSTPAPVRPCFTILGLAADVILALAREHARDGRIGVTELETLVTAVRNGPVALDAVLAQHEGRCRAEHTRPKSIGARMNPFRRLVVRPFEDLLADGSLERTCLPGYFAAVDCVLGTAASTTYESRCRAVVQRLLVLHGNNLTWDSFYAEEEIIAILADATVRIAHALNTPAMRASFTATCVISADGSAMTTEQAEALCDILIHTARGLVKSRRAAPKEA